MNTTTPGARFRAGQLSTRVVHVLNRPWLRVSVTVLVLAVAVWSFRRVPDASWGRP